MLKWRDVDLTDCPLGVGMILTTVRYAYSSSNFRLIISWFRVYCHYSSGLVSAYNLVNSAALLLVVLRYHAPSPQLPLIPEPLSTLINGLGRSSGGSTSVAVISVLQNRRYRFRLVSIACAPSYVFSIDGHNMVCPWYLDVMFMKSTFGHCL